MEDRISVYLKKINDLIEKYINNNLKKYNLTLSQGRVLEYLQNNKEKEVTQKEIEQQFNITHATVSGIIFRLESNGFIKVNRNKRVNKIILLEKSYENEKIIIKYQDELEKCLSKSFNCNEKEDFLNNLKKIYVNLKEEE